MNIGYIEGIANAILVLHAENKVIMGMVCKETGLDNEKIHDMQEEWDNEMQKAFGINPQNDGKKRRNRPQNDGKEKKE